MGEGSVAVVVPWRAGCPHREGILDWARRRWPWPVILGECPDGPWRKAVAVSAGISRTDAEVLVVADADVWCPTKQTVDAVLDGPFRWGFPHRGIRRLTGDATDAILNGILIPQNVNSSHLEEPATRAHPGGGIVVLRRDAWNEAPLDPRFEGWGHEDDAWGWVLATLAGLPAKGNERLIHLWHPPQERRSRQRGSAASYLLQERYWRARHRPAEMRALLAEIREEVMVDGC